MKPVVCILSGVLGNRIMSEKIAASVDRYAGTPAERIWLDEQAYRRHPAPAFVRRISALESELVTRRLLSTRRFSGVVVANGYTLALAARPRGGKLIVATDTTPRLINDMLASGRSALKRLMGTLQHERFRRLAAGVEQWLPISHTCERSLIEDYGVPPDRIRVTRAPQREIHRSAVRQRLQRPSELLFVGNDFRRKGGTKLLEVFQERLLPDCTLTIVSNDPALPDTSIDGVTILRGIKNPEGVSAAYRKADLLVLPTGVDHYPNVICEAMAHGLPFLATRVGALPELIDDSGAGLSLPNDPTPMAIAETVRLALANETEHVQRSAAAIEFAERHLTFAAFDTAVHGALHACNGHDDT